MDTGNRFINAPKDRFLKRGADLWITYNLIKRLTTPFEDTEAFKIGLIDKTGNPMKKINRMTPAEKSNYTVLDRIIFKLKQLLNKTGIGKSKLATYAAALWLIKENKNLHHYENEFNLLESFELFLLKNNFESDIEYFLIETYERNISSEVNFLNELKRNNINYIDLVNNSNYNKFYNNLFFTEMMGVSAVAGLTGDPPVSVGAQNRYQKRNQKDNNKRKKRLRDIRKISML